MADEQSYTFGDGFAQGNYPDRHVMTRRLAETEEVDVLVVGAGINGCAVFRELALQGVACVIVDREDYGAGASSASTRMAHGGLRYLENGEFRLVAEATRERNRLLRNAAHTIRPLLVTIPSFSVFGGMAPTFAKLFGIEHKIRSRGLMLLRLGLLIYDVFSRRQPAMPSHTLTNAAATRRLLPDLHPAVRGVASYYDASITHAERVAFELVADGLAATPAGVALNHCALVRANGRQVILRDLVADREYAIAPRLVINATGAWIDAVNGLLAPMRDLIGGTKGSHLVIDNPALHIALRNRAFSFDDGTGRMCITYPLGDKVLLGSTDIRVSDVDAAVCDEAEIEYLLGAIRVIFPLIDVRRDQVRFRFCGVRPLPRSDGIATVNISRDHSIVRRDPDDSVPYPILSLIGGKWTTFRAFAEQIADQVVATLGKARRCGTQNTPIGGGREYPTTQQTRTAWLNRVAAATKCDVARLEQLLDRYGTRAELVARFCAAGTDHGLLHAPDYSQREVLFLVRHEHAVSLADIIYRRTNIAMWGRLSFALLSEIAEIMATASGVPAVTLIQDVVPRLLRDNGIDYTTETACLGAPRVERDAVSALL